MFREDAKRFYRELGKKTIKIQKPPDIGEVKKFWQNILEQEISDKGPTRGTQGYQLDGVEGLHS